MIMRCILLFFCILIQTEKLFADGICDGVDGQTCCSGYKWHKLSRKCIECSPGYHGHGCNNVCPYPSFGKLCRSECKCDNSSCSPEIGCSNITDKEIPVQINKTSERAEKTKQEQITKSLFYNETYFEERIRHIMKTYVSRKSDHETIRILSFATLASGLAIFILLVLVLIKRVAKILIRPNVPRQSMTSNAISDPYDHLVR